MHDKSIPPEARLPIGQTIPLSLQHLFAMFGSTVLVPILFKINPATVLLFNGIGTLIYGVKLLFNYGFERKEEVVEGEPDDDEEA